MSRLLSEEAVIHSLMDFVSGKKTIGQCIEDTPTAYDVDKVVEQLNSPYIETRREGSISLKQAIEIVKAGGIE